VVILIIETVSSTSWLKILDRQLRSVVRELVPFAMLWAGGWPQLS